MDWELRVFTEITSILRATVSLSSSPFCTCNQLARRSEVEAFELVCLAQTYHICRVVTVNDSFAKR